MTALLDISLVDALLDVIDVHVGASPVLELRTGAPPATAAAADEGTVLATLNLPSVWLGASSSGKKRSVSAWTGAAAVAGTAGHFRIKQNGVTHIQGTVSGLAGQGDVKLSNATLMGSESITIDPFIIAGVADTLGGNIALDFTNPDNSQYVGTVI